MGGSSDFPLLSSGWSDLIFFGLLFISILYTLGAFSLFRIAQNNEVKRSWLAFVPIVQFYVLGKIVKDFWIFNFHISKPEFILPIVPILTAVVLIIPLAGFLAVIANSVLMIFALFNLFRIYKEDNVAAIFTVVGTIFIFLLPIFLFIIRNAEPLYDEE